MKRTGQVVLSQPDRPHAEEQHHSNRRCTRRQRSEIAPGVLPRMAGLLTSGAHDLGALRLDRTWAPTCPAFLLRLPSTNKHIPTLQAPEGCKPIFVQLWPFLGVPPVCLLPSSDPSGKTQQHTQKREDGPHGEQADGQQQGPDAQDDRHNGWGEILLLRRSSLLGGCGLVCALGRTGCHPKEPPPLGGSRNETN